MVSTGVASIQSGIQALKLSDIHRMRIEWERDFDLDQMRRVVSEFPNRSVWSPSTGEVIIVGDWRRRPEIASIVGMRAVRERRELMQAAVDQSKSLGLEAFLALEWNERQRPAFYERLGFELLDAVIPFEVQSSRFGHSPTTGAGPIRVNPFDDRRLTQLLQVDHAAFPWLWINSAAEFENYFETPGLEIWGHECGGRLVSYVGFTYFGEWGHIDRIAVHPQVQRQGRGQELILTAMQQLRQRGSLTVGLSTQTANWKSQRLYHQLGFKRSPQNAYRVYGQVFGRDSGSSGD